MDRAEPGATVASRTVAAAGWLVAGRAATRAIDLLALVILVRLLGPSEFGIIAAALPVILIIEALFELPLHQALVRLPVVTETLLGTAFTLGLLRGVTVALLVAALAWPYALFNNDPALGGLVAALGLAPALRGLASPAMVAFTRRIDFRREVLVDLLGKAGACLVMMGTGLLTHSHWAIAAGTIAGPAIGTIASYVIAPLRPRLTLAGWRSFAGLLGWNSLAQWLAAANWQIDRLLLGHAVPRIDLGRYAMANDLGAAPYQMLVLPILRPLIVGFAGLKEDRLRLGNAYARAVGGVVMIGAPVLVGLATLADAIVRLVLGADWQEAGPMLAGLALSGVAPLLVSPFASLAMALNRTQFVALQATIEFTGKVPAMVLAVFTHGVAGAVVVRVLAGLLATLSALLLARRLVGLRVRDQLGAAWRPLCAAGTMGLLLQPLNSGLARLQGITLAAGLAGAAMTGAAIYALLLALLWHTSGRPMGVEAMLGVRLTTSLERGRRRPPTGQERDADPVLPAAGASSGRKAGDPALP